MDSNVIAIDSARPDRWQIDIRAGNAPSVVCFFSERSQCWVGMLDAASVDTLPEVLRKAKKVMKSARMTNTRINVKL